MKKLSILFLVLCMVVSVTSCASKTGTEDSADPIEYIFSDVEASKLKYKGSNYTEYHGPHIKSFCPYIYLSYLDGDTVVELNDDGFCVDSRDVNCNFICSPSKLLSFLYFIKDGVEIPEKIDNPEYVNSICIEFEEQKFYVTDEKNISVLIDYFNSEDVVSLGYYQLIPVPAPNINIEAVSDYYGGVFDFVDRGMLHFEDGKLYLTNGNETLEAPTEVNNILFAAINGTSDSSTS